MKKIKNIILIALLPLLLLSSCSKEEEDVIWKYRVQGMYTRTGFISGEVDFQRINNTWLDYLTFTSNGERRTIYFPDNNRTFPTTTIEHIIIQNFKNYERPLTPENSRKFEISEYKNNELVKEYEIDLYKTIKRLGYYWLIEER